jgi:hypothetical protein
LDLAFALPMFVVVGGWLLRHDRRAAAGSLATLAFTVLMGASVVAIFAVDAAAGIVIELAPVVVFGVVTVVATVLLASSLRSTGSAAAVHSRAAVTR